jgi:putative phosphoesterase
MTGSEKIWRIGVLSDTHGLLRTEAVSVLRGVEMIIHAGDIGKPEILAELEAIAPIIAVRGNNDKGDWAAAIPETHTVEALGVSIYVLHDLKQLSIDPLADGHTVVIAGHSHKPKIEEKGGVLYLNPGSCGRRRFRLPVTVALLTLAGGRAAAEIIDLHI